MTEPKRLSHFLGWHIDHAISEAIKTAKSDGKPVVFSFNEVDVTVAPGSSHGLIYRDWSRAMAGFIPGKVGPHPSELSAADIANDARVQAETEACRSRADEERGRQALIDKAEVEAALEAAPEFDLVDAALWASGLSKNPDSYGRCVYDFAETWARLMQAEIGKGRSLADVADACCSLADKRFGITGFMYGCAVSILSKVWRYGEDLNRWHNGKYGRPDAEGTVNPAILVFKDAAA